MSQRGSGYERKERDLYETPEWATIALLPHLHARLNPRDLVFEPAAGGGKMVAALEQCGFYVDAADITTGADFLKCQETEAKAIITNPPYELAREFIERALTMMRDRGGLVAMLLRTDYDHAKTRQHLFSGHQAFAKKVVLTKRIKWFEDSKGQPSFNHAWFIWDWQHKGAPVLAYGP